MQSAKKKAKRAIPEPATSPVDTTANPRRRTEDPRTVDPTPAMRVAAIGLRCRLGIKRADAVAQALECSFDGWSGARLALLPGVSNNAIDGDSWAKKVRAAARDLRTIVLFESKGKNDQRSFWGYDGTADANLLAVQQVFATSSEADKDRSLVDRVLSRSNPGGTGSAWISGRWVGLLVCGENNVLRNQQSSNNAVFVRHYPYRRLFEHAEIICNGAHTVMGNWGKLDRRFDPRI